MSASTRFPYATVAFRHLVTRALVLSLATLLWVPAHAATLHVAQDSPDPLPPFDSWEHAARSIQEAADAAQPGDVVLVTNGVYATGGRLALGSLTNRLVVPPRVIVQSVSGPDLTIIEGAPAPVTSDKNGNGDEAIRCVFLGRDAVLAGFTLRNGHTRTNGHYELDQSGGGAWCADQGQLIKCVLSNNAAFHMGGAGFRIALDQSQAIGNTARYGGALCLGTASDSQLSGNSAEYGGGAYMSYLTRCTVTTNSANIGGGAMGGSALDSVIQGNSAGQWGGGTSQVSLQRCRIFNNIAERGGGAFLSTLFGCVVVGNRADLGGGAAGGTLSHTTVTGNSAGSGGGVYLTSVRHSIVYFNDGIFGANHEGSTFLNSSTFPEPESGTGNIDADPRLAGSFRISSESPAVAPDSGTLDLPSDLDGEPWSTPSQMGADQWNRDQATGPLLPAIVGGTPIVAAGHALLWRADIEGRVSSSTWDFGQGTTVTNQAYFRHAWDQPGNYIVTLTAYNSSHPDGISTSFPIQVVEPPVLYVAVSSPRPAAPFSSWDTAATSIQAAIEAARIPGSLVLVTNGIYRQGAVALPGDVVRNRIAITNAITVRSVNGPGRTLIAGDGPISDFAIRAAFVGRDAVLSGFTLTNGHTRTFGAPLREQRGGGVTGDPLARITNCVITGGLARQFGGGAYRAHLQNCILVRNQALDGGGGAYECLLEDCSIENNKASNSGGGISRSTVRNSLITSNSAPVGAGAYFGTLDGCRIQFNVTEGDGYGGGVNGSTVRDSLLVTNAAHVGGGAYAATVLRSRLEGNEARRNGGGAAFSTLTDSQVTGNTASYGGGASGGSLTRCEITANEASVAGGGADGCSLEACQVSRNSAYYGGGTHDASLQRTILRENSAVFGGASYRDFHSNSLLVRNTASNRGGASFESILIHSTAVLNHAESGGGAFGGTNRSSILYFNSALVGPDFQDSTLISSCTAPSPALLPGNITNNPAFLDPAAGDFRLRADSPCIDAAPDPNAIVLNDLAGISRPIDGDLDGLARTDLGAHEFNPESSDSNNDGIPDSWVLRYGLDPFDADFAARDPDQDGLNNRQEWIADTHPVDATSAFALSQISLGPSVSIRFPSVRGRLYTLLVHTNTSLAAASDAPWTPVDGQSLIPGTGEALVLQDAPASDNRYYRVEVRLQPAPPAVASVRTLTATPTPTVQPATIPFVRPDLLLAMTSDATAGISSRRSSMPPPPAVSGTLSLSSSSRSAALHAATPQVITQHPFRIHDAEGIPISPMLRGQEPFMLYGQSARTPTLELGRGSTFRGVAGGTDAETYDWKTLSSASRPHEWSFHVSDPPSVTTLEWLKEARDYRAELVLTVNTRGRGRTLTDTLGRRVWTLDPLSNSPDFLAQLAADWVRYANFIAPQYRLTHDRQLPLNLAETDPESARILEELRAAGNGTNAWKYRLATEFNRDIEVDPPLERPLLLEHNDTSPTPRVTYWEIGNEVETPMNHSNPGQTRFLEDTINHTPAQYVTRYLRITEAMKRVDPRILVGPCPNNPWGPVFAVENEHLIQLLARKEATIDVFYHHYYYTWIGNYFRPSDVNRNLRALKNYAHLLNSQYSAQFARAGRPLVPFIISEWNPDFTIHPPVERFMVSALATAEVFFTFAELGHLGAHYWENPDGRASRFVFERLPSHLGDRLIGSSAGTPADDGSYGGFGLHPSASTDVRVYATRRSDNGKVLVWMLNLSETTAHTVSWTHPFPVASAVTHTLRDTGRPTAYYTSISQLQWVSEPISGQPTSTRIAPATIVILELDYLRPENTPPPPPVIASISPLHGRTNSEVRITGAGFSASPDANAVHFGRGRATVLEASESSLRVLVPATATYGPISVTTGGRSATSSDYFTLTDAENRDSEISMDAFEIVPERLLPPEGAPIVTAPTDLQFIDSDGSGKLQIAGLTWRTGSILPHTIDLFPNHSSPGSIRFSTPFCEPQLPQCSLNLNSSPGKFSSADLDGDGLLDLACVDRHAWHLAVWRNAGPNSERSFDITGIYPTSRNPSYLAIHDLDSDGRPDIAVANAADSHIGVHLNRSPGPGFIHFSTNAVFRPAHAADLSSPHTLAIGNLVGDARPDIAVASRSSPAIVIFRNESTPGRPYFVAMPAIPAPSMESMTLGDVDADGRLDIIASGQWPNGGIHILRNNDADGFEPTFLPTTRDPRQFSLADMTGDGRPDVVTVNNDTVSFSILRNQSEPGVLRFADRQDFSIPGLLPNDPISIGVADLDGDGRKDLAVGNYYSGHITLIRRRP